MDTNIRYRWYKSPNGPKHPVAAAVSLLVIFLAIAVASVLLEVYLIGGALAALALTTVVAFVKAEPRVTLVGNGTEVLPRPTLANPNRVFPILAFVAAVLITLQPIVGQSMGANRRFTVIVIAIWVVVVASMVTVIKQRGNLLIDSDRIAVGTHRAVLLQDVQLTVVQARKRAIPHIELVDKSGKTKKRLIFPKKYYGLDADSVYSTVRHLAETDVETRRNYSPELIREMLLFTPKHEVAVGESIEVRVVAQPRATTS